MVHKECNICKKKTFYNKHEFIEAHGGKRDFTPDSSWIIVTKKEAEGESTMFSYKAKCRNCGVNKPPHKNKCPFYKEPDSIVEPAEIFDWESYWKWWFGVDNLDFDSKRFFGKY